MPRTRKQAATAEVPAVKETAETVETPKETAAANREVTAADELLARYLDNQVLDSASSAGGSLRSAASSARSAGQSRVAPYMNHINALEAERAAASFGVATSPAGPQRDSHAKRVVEVGLAIKHLQAQAVEASGDAEAFGRALRTSGSSTGSQSSSSVYGSALAAAPASTVSKATAATIATAVTALGRVPLSHLGYDALNAYVLAMERDGWAPEELMQRPTAWLTDAVLTAAEASVTRPARPSLAVVRKVLLEAAAPHRLSIQRHFESLHRDTREPYLVGQALFLTAFRAAVLRAVDHGATPDARHVVGTFVKGLKVKFYVGNTTLAAQPEERWDAALDRVGKVVADQAVFIADALAEEARAPAAQEAPRAKRTAAAADSSAREAGPARQPESTGRAAHRAPGACFTCHSHGHYAADCPATCRVCHSPSHGENACPFTPQREELARAQAAHAAAVPRTRGAPSRPPFKSGCAQRGPGFTAAAVGFIMLFALACGSFGNPMALIDTGTDTTYINERYVDTHGEGAVAIGRFRNMTIQTPFAGPITARGRNVTFDVVTATGALVRLVAFSTELHGEFGEFDIILSGDDARLLGLAGLEHAGGDTGDPSDPGPAGDPGGRTGATRANDPRGGGGGGTAAPTTTQAPPTAREGDQAQQSGSPGGGTSRSSWARSKEKTKSFTFFDQHSTLTGCNDGPEDAQMRARGFSPRGRGTTGATSAASDVPRITPAAPPRAPSPVLHDLWENAPLLGDDYDPDVMRARGFSVTRDPSQQRAPAPDAGVTVPLLDREGATVAYINAAYTNATVTDPEAFIAQRDELAELCRVNLALPLKRHFTKPFPITPTADAAAHPNLYNEARIAPTREVDKVVQRKLVEDGLAHGYIAEWRPAPGDPLGRPLGRLWALCPLFVVRDGPKERCVLDCRVPNSLTDVSTICQTPFMLDQIDSVLNATCFTVTDAKNGFYARSVVDDPDTSIRMCFKLDGKVFYFTSLSMGGVLSPGHFQACMQEFCGLVGGGAMAYADDVTQRHTSPTTTPEGLYDVTQPMREAIEFAKHLASQQGFVHSAKKTVFLAGSAVVCGRQTGSGRATIPVATLTAALELDPPVNSRDCASLGGVFNDLSPYVPGLGVWAGTLTQLSKGKGSLARREPHVLPAALAAFSNAMACLLNVPPVRSFTPTTKTVLILYHDACRDGIAFILATCEWDGDGAAPRAPPASWLPVDNDTTRLHYIKVGSRATRAAEKTMSASDIEMAGSRFAHKNCNSLLWGRHVVVVSDHRAWVLALSSEHPQPKHLRTLILASEGFSVTAVHGKGATANPSTDILSRAHWRGRASVADATAYEHELCQKPPQWDEGAALAAAGFSWPQGPACTCRSLGARAAAGSTQPNTGRSRAHPPQHESPEVQALRAAAAADPAPPAPPGARGAATGAGTTRTLRPRGTTSTTNIVQTQRGRTRPAQQPAAPRRSEKRAASLDPISDSDAASSSSGAILRASEASGSSAVGDVAPGTRSKKALALLTPCILFRASDGEAICNAHHPDPAWRWVSGLPRFNPTRSKDREDLVSGAHSRCAHLGAPATAAHVRAGGNDWEGLNRDVATHCEECPSCQVWATAAPGFNERPIDLYNEVRAGAHLAMDVTHMLSTADGYSCILVVGCVATGFIFAHPLRGETAAEILHAADLIFAMNGPFARLTVDNNAVLAGLEMAALAGGYGAEVVATAEYSSSNRAELFCKKVGDGVRRVATAASNPKLWKTLLQGTVCALNGAFTRKTGTSPFERYHARPYPLPLPASIPENPDLLLDLSVAERRAMDLVARHNLGPIRAAAVSEAMARRAAKFKSSHKIVYFTPGSLVVVHRHNRAAKWRERWDGPFVVVRRSLGGAYTLAVVDDGKVLRRRFLPQKLKLWRGTKTKEPNYQVDRIRAWRVTEDGSPEYLVHWRDFADADDTWEPPASFLDDRTIPEFLATNPEPTPYLGNVKPTH